MASTGSQKSSYDELLEALVDLGSKAFDPSIPESAREPAQQEFEDYVQNAGTVPIIPALNTLIQPNKVPPWLRAEFVRLLAAVPLRRYGVRATLEFVFAVHPTTVPGGAAQAAATTGGPRPSKAGEQQKRRNATITQEAMAMASRLLSMPPASISADAWFAGIAPQLMEILDGDHGLELTKVAAYVVGFGILGRRQFGAPGTAGWRSFVDPMLKAIKPGPQEIESLNTAGSDGVVDLSKPSVLVSPADLATGLRRLHHLVVSHPNPGLARRLISPVLLPLWSLTSRGTPETKESDEDDYFRPAQNLLTIYLKVAGSLDPVTTIIHNLLYNGERDSERLLWLFDELPERRMQIIVPPPQQAFRLAAEGINLPQAEQRGQKLLALLGSVFTDEEISTVFLDLFGRWVKSSGQKETSILPTKDEGSTGQDPTHLLLENQVLQAMMLKFPERLASQPGHILKLVDEILAQPDGEQQDDEVISVALSLLNMIATTPNFRRNMVNKELMESIEQALGKLSRHGSGDVSTTAANLALFLKYRDGFEPEDSAPSQTDRQVQDRKTYALAVSYISDTDSPAPVRSEGLNLIQSLVLANSPVLDISAVLVLLSKLLAEDEDYINLRVVKMYTQLADRHPKSVTRELIDRYVDAAELAAVDTRLRFGEALMQVVERLGQTFAGDVARQVCEALLLLAGRRGHRPKTEAKQARDEKLRRLKAERGELDDDDDDAGPEQSERQREDNEMLARIRRRLGFGLTDESRADMVRVLGYVADTDGDGLVRQHAKDVVESLENFQLGMMMPEVDEKSGGGGVPAIARLAGIQLDLRNVGAGNAAARPVIEEIE
ncbi:hypothetical protein MAPG_08383 [Magnaporthiopsis poae ATCC 64411]|uniref:RNA polymerase II assembly factor Rtp1 C-terminal domain-containing protein n=1 Tax=Magnaporthiopsis poae (strain ATCC 64411 / 73-15) TaxID=644358 RepID=A0A0C4E780_MAGP6|nr:hypothetical protein MAPG_08383 [Magnaporthiopsis poae ATCC 64411]